MRKIELKDNANLGGLMSIVAVPPTAVYELSKRKNHTAFEYNDALAIEIYCTEGTMHYNRNAEEGIKIAGSTPRISADGELLFRQLEVGYWLVVFEDNNGEKRLAGDMSNQLAFRRTETTGTLGEKNEIKWEFWGKTMNQPLFISNLS